MSTPENSQPLIRFNWFRFTLCLFFLVYTFIVARGLIPLPDEPPRIKFLEVFCCTLGLVFAYHALVSRSILMIPSIIIFLSWPARLQLSERIEFLQMMIEPFRPETILIWSLWGVGIFVLLPKSFKTFNEKPKSHPKKRSRLFPRGFPF